MKRVRLYKSNRLNTSIPLNRMGAYTVEFALAASILFMTVCFGLEFSRYMFVRHSLDQAAFEAARVAVSIGSNVDQAQTAARTVLAGAGVFNASVLVSPQNLDTTTMEVTVRVSCSFGRNSWLPPSIFGSEPMVATVTLDHENKAYLSARTDVGNNKDAPNNSL